MFQETHKKHLVRFLLPALLKRSQMEGGRVGGLGGGGGAGWCGGWRGNVFSFPWGCFSSRMRDVAKNQSASRRTSKDGTSSHVQLRGMMQHGPLIGSCFAADVKSSLRSLRVQPRSRSSLPRHGVCPPHSESCKDPLG